MFEILKIKCFGQQPIARITAKTLDRILKRDYQNSFTEVKRKLELIHTDTLNGRNRLSAAVLKLSNKDATRIDKYIETCNNDFRDIISKAEYPRMAEQGFDEIDKTKQKQLYMEDWIEYSNWLTKI